MRISSDTRLFRCSACDTYKSSAEFSFSDEARRSLNSYCRKCHAAYRHAHYLANKPDYIRRAIAQVNGRRVQNRREVMTYLASHPCIDCGVDNVIVLEFDHRDPKDKLTNVGNMISSKRWARVRAEIEKCDVRCVNCHRRKTARDFHWLKTRPAS
ncbi:MAG TPA: hypothetical protein VIN74_06030 [Candidatus Limnocylindria bacterium]|jgi:hypothetical protein